MRDRVSSVLTSWPFLCSVVLLLLNDGWLKFAHPGLMSGKLSDFSGIAMIGLLFLAAWPKRPLVVYAVCSAVFAWWKSPWSDPLIDLLNACAPVRFGRTVDYTDLVALLMLPICSRFVTRPRQFELPWQRVRRFLFVPVVAATVFGTAATSVVPTRADYLSEYVSPEQVHEVITEVVARHGLACDACPLSDGSMVFRGGGLTMTYRYSTANGIAVTIEPSIGEKAGALRSALRSAVAERLKPLCYLESPRTPG